MSDANAPLEGTDTEQAPEGQAEAGVEQSAPEQQPVDYLDLDETAYDRHVRVKVDGEEVSVPLREALQGYSRTQDYTQKTQALAEQRRQAEEALVLQQAMQAAPGLAVQILAQRAGVSVEEFLGMTPAQQQAATAEPEYDDPLEKALATERQRVNALEQRLAQQEADRVLMDSVNGLKQRFQLDDNQVREVVTQAFQLGLPPQMLPMVYQSMAFQRSQAQQEARNQFQGQQNQATQQRQAAAQAAQQVIATGTGAVGTTTERGGDGNMSLAEAIEAGMQGWVDRP